MSFIPTEPNQVNEGEWIIKCCSCGKEVGRIDHTEILDFLAYLTETAELVLCFACETDYQLSLMSIRNFQNRTLTVPLV